MSVLLLVIYCCFIVSSVNGDEGTRLIRAGDVWRYYKGTNEPAMPLGAWRLAEFDDSAWPQSISGFSTYTYAPEPGYLTDYGYFYRTLYSRRKFQVQDTNSLAELVLRIDYDDGFVAYLNGREVVRRGVTGATDEPLPVNTFALPHLRGPTEEIDLTASLPLLRNGENLLAIQVFGSAVNDYAVALVPELVANFTREPYVQNTTSNSVQIIFKTLSAAPAFIEVGTNAASSARISLSEMATNHVAILTGLSPDTRYEYRVGAQIRGKEVLTDWYEFRTFKTSGPVHFALLGDSGWGSAGQHQIAAAMRAAAPDFTIHLGDVVYYAFTHFAEDFRFFSVYADQLATTPMFLTMGNHELYADWAAALQSFYLPTNTVTKSEHFYSFDHGDVHFTVIWSDLQAHSEYGPGSAQYEWLDNDLASSTKPWKFLFFHHVWRSSGIHVTDDYDVNRVRDTLQLSEGPVALAQKHGVQVIFNGHDHDYERFTPSGGVLSVVSGGGGGSLYAMYELHPDSVQHFFRYQFLNVTVEGDQATIESVGANGKPFDTIHINRFQPERKIFQARWHSAAVVQNGKPDGDGNKAGEYFDFSSEPIGGKVGVFSSSGRLFVHNDNTHLYLGLDEVMLHPGDELFVFLETPGLPGITNSAQIGKTSYTNSLETLRNLEFTNFTPGVGIVLGDEFGDGGFEIFTRAGSSNNTAQGAFYLKNELPLVREQRLTQFNRSPQDGAVPYEQNANFVQIALPYSALNVRPGDTIKVGAVIGLRQLDDRGETARRLDSGIGYSVYQTNGVTILEGVQVQLEQDLDLDDDGLTEDEERAIGTDPAKPDTDTDQMPDGWEVTYHLDPLNADAQEDTDQDGMSNFGEWIAGTDPTDGESRLSLFAAHGETGLLDLEWTAVPGKLYKLQERNDVMDMYRDIVDLSLPRRASGTTESISLRLAPGAGSRYYRVVIIAE